MILSPREEAAHKKQRIYFGAKPCRKGHRQGRYTSSGACAQCVRDSSNATHARIREALNA